MAAANLVQNGGFETGNLSGWALSGDPTTTQVNLGFSHSGIFGLVFGALDKPEFISQTLATAPGQAYTLSFWMGGGDNTGGNEFIVKWSTTTLLDQLNLVVPSWTNMQFQVTATATSTILSFGGWDNVDYIYLDDVSVAIPSSDSPPTFLSSNVTSGLIHFSWSGVLNRSYQVLSTTNLLQGTWINVGESVTATNTVMTESDTIGPEVSRFYRVVLLP
jgi:hypothetical protein